MACILQTETQLQPNCPDKNQFKPAISEQQHLHLSDNGQSLQMGAKLQPTSSRHQHPHPSGKRQLSYNHQMGTNSQRIPAMQVTYFLNPTVCILWAGTKLQLTNIYSLHTSDRGQDTTRTMLPCNLLHTKVYTYSIVVILLLWLHSELVCLSGVLLCRLS